MFFRLQTRFALLSSGPMVKFKVNISAEIRNYRRRHPKAELRELATRFGRELSRIKSDLEQPLDPGKGNFSGAVAVPFVFGDLSEDARMDLASLLRTGLGLHEALAECVTAGMDAVLLRYSTAEARRELHDRHEAERVAEGREMARIEAREWGDFDDEAAFKAWHAWRKAQREALPAESESDES